MPSNEIQAFESKAPVREMSTEESRFQPVMSIQSAVNRYKQIQDIVTQLMEEGEDFGLVPGSKKRSLFKPGAQKLCNIFGLTPRYEEVSTIEDWTGREYGEPMFYYRIRCALYRGDYLIGEGEGSATSWESKYRYRNKERECPKCGKAAIVKGKAEWGGGWICFAKLGGCGAKYPERDPAIAAQRVGKVPNPDIFDQVNTILKMASKRAYIASVLEATGASRFFTQDVEDNAPAEPEALPAEPAEAIPGITPEQREKMRTAFELKKKQLGDNAYHLILGERGFAHWTDIADIDQARWLMERMQEAWKVKTEQGWTTSDTPEPE